jgi:hypothetical protein
MRSGYDRIRTAAVALALAAWAGDARASDGPVDPSYGRVDGDVDVVAGVGGVVAKPGVRALGELRLRYLESAGVYATFEDAGVLSSPSEPRTVFVAGLELRPLFLYRWLRGHETRRVWFDLALDSFGLDLGAMFEQPAGSGFASRRGLEVGVGIELPILGRASGPWFEIRGAVRWSDAALGSGIEGADDLQAVLAVTLAWHQIFSAHVVDAP